MTTGGMFGDLFNNNLIDSFEESDLGRRALFTSFAPQGQTATQQAQFSSLYEPTFNSYLGEIGRGIRGGDTSAANQSFTDFLGSGNQFDPNRQLLQLPGFSTGGQGGLGPQLFNFGGR